VASTVAGQLVAQTAVVAQMDRLATSLAAAGAELKVYKTVARLYFLYYCNNYNQQAPAPHQPLALQRSLLVQ
jgi:hypothetical protein